MVSKKKDKILIQKKEFKKVDYKIPLASLEKDIIYQKNIKPKLKINYKREKEKKLKEEKNTLDAQIEKVI